MIDFEEICKLNKEIVEKYDEPYGVMNEGALLFSLDEFKENPYKKSNTYLIAKILISLTNNHCFIEGNKRTGRMVLALILDFFNAKILLTKKEIDDLFIFIAQGNIDANMLENILLEKIILND